jgi:hypothetical protein
MRIEPIQTSQEVFMLHDDEDGSVVATLFEVLEDFDDLPIWRVLQMKASKLKTNEIVAYNMVLTI